MLRTGHGFVSRTVGTEWIDLSLWWTNLTEAKGMKPCHSPISIVAKDVGSKKICGLFHHRLQISIKDSSRQCRLHQWAPCRRNTEQRRLRSLATSLQLSLDEIGVAHVQTGMLYLHL